MNAATQHQALAELHTTTAQPAKLLASTYRITGCAWQRDGSFLVDFDAGEGTSFYAILRADIEQNRPYVSAWSPRVESIERWEGADVVSVADLSVWVQANRQVVENALVDAFLEGLENSRRWR